MQVIWHSDMSGANIGISTGGYGRGVVGASDGTYTGVYGHGSIGWPPVSIGDMADIVRAHPGRVGGHLSPGIQKVARTNSNLMDKF